MTSVHNHHHNDMYAIALSICLLKFCKRNVEVMLLFVSACSSHAAWQKMYSQNAWNHVWTLSIRGQFLMVTYVSTQYLKVSSPRAIGSGHHKSL